VMVGLMINHQGVLMDLEGNVIDEKWVEEHIW
jgi:hypothetical protein